MSKPLRDQFPGFKVINLPGGFRVQCRSDCFQIDGASGGAVRRSHAEHASIPEVRAWVAAHQHGMTRREAYSEAKRRAHIRRYGADPAVTARAGHQAPATGDAT